MPSGIRKLMVNELGEESERRRLAEWCERHRIPPEAQAELQTILYGKQTLNKGEL